MKNKKKNHPINDLNEMLGIFGRTLNFIATLDYQEPKDPRDNDVVHLGHGITLELDKTIEKNQQRYSKLYKNGVLLSNDFFRLGGMSYGFEKKPYCMLIVYRNIHNETWGNHCIIDKDGKIVLEADEYDSNFYYFKGVIASKKGVVYNLLSGQPIVKSTKMFESSDFYFIEHNYDYEKKYPLGVYKINKNTGEYEIFN